MMEMAATVMGASHKRNHTQQQQREHSYENHLKHALKDIPRQSFQRSIPQKPG